MSRYEFKLPDIGEGVMEGEIVSWLVRPGDDVAEDQPMVEVMTDKATVTITSPKAGKVLEVAGDVGKVVPVHSVLLVLELPNGQSGGAEADDVATAAGSKSDEGPAASAVGDIKEQLPGMGLMSKAAAPSAAASTSRAAAQPTSDYFSEKPLATPATRKLARELGIDLRTVRPTGRGGRVLKGDVQAMAGGAPQGASPMAVRSGPPVAVTPGSAEEGALEVRTPLRGMRKRIFDAMARSKHTAAHFTFVEECDVTALKQVRARLKPAAEAAGVKLSFLPFIIKAVSAALQKHPVLNSAFDESTQEVVQRGYFHIGIASATDKGLMVPVVRNANHLSILEIAREVARLSEETKSGTIAADELRGSTFTVTSLGKQGGLFATPVLNHPEVGILGVHQMKQKPVVRDGEIVIGDVMLLSLSFDHRLIDGHVGAAFAYEIIAILENPELLLLELR